MPSIWERAALRISITPSVKSLIARLSCKLNFRSYFGHRTQQFLLSTANQVVSADDVAAFTRTTSVDKLIPLSTIAKHPLEETMHLRIVCWEVGVFVSFLCLLLSEAVFPPLIRIGKFAIVCPTPVLMPLSDQFSSLQVRYLRKSQSVSVQRLSLELSRWTATKTNCRQPDWFLL